jgi:hypothetical protein
MAPPDSNEVLLVARCRLLFPEYSQKQFQPAYRAGRPRSWAWLFPVRQDIVPGQLGIGLMTAGHRRCYAIPN